MKIGYTPFGFGQVSQGSMAAQAGRGSDPMAQRRAMLAGAQGYGQVQAQAGQARNKEMAMARGAQLQTADSLRQGELDWAQQMARIERARSEHKAAMEMADAAEHQQDMQIVGAAAGAGGSMLGMLSDERMKARIRVMSRAAQDAMAGGRV